MICCNKSINFDICVFFFEMIMENVHVQQNKAMRSSSNVNRRLSAVTNGNTSGRLNDRNVSEQSRVLFPIMLCALLPLSADTCTPQKRKLSRNMFPHPPSSR